MHIEMQQSTRCLARVVVAQSSWVAYICHQQNLGQLQENHVDEIN